MSKKRKKHKILDPITEEIRSLLIALGIINTRAKKNKLSIS